MNRDYIGQASPTIGTVMMAGMLASTFLPSNCNNAPPSSMPHFSASYNYAYLYRGTPLTHESSKNVLTGYYPSSVETTFETVVTSFFEELSSNQEPLGHEFEQVLFENLWDLYQS
jgi:hypothetical protein